jgi:hypothetical protein
LQAERIDVNDDLHAIKNKESKIFLKILQAQVVSGADLQEFELSNMIRLGLVKEEKEFYANSQTLEIPNDRDEYRSYLNVDLDIDLDSNVENIFTELGELFINACKEKK